MIAKVHKMVLEDCRLKVREISEAIGKSSERACYILSEELGMEKLSARWMPLLLTQNQKRIRVEISEECLVRFERNQEDFSRRFVTTDEILVR